MSGKPKDQESCLSKLNLVLQVVRLIVELLK